MDARAWRRYTINDSSKQIVWLVIPHSQLMDARAFIDGTLKKAAPALVGFLLIAAQSLSGDAAEELVVPLGFVALCGALATLPLVVHIAGVHAAALSEAARNRLRSGVWGKVLGLRKDAASTVGKSSFNVLSAKTADGTAAASTGAAAEAKGAPLVREVEAGTTTPSSIPEAEEAEDEEEEWDDEEFEALEHNTIADVVSSGDYARAAHRQREGGGRSA